MNWHNFVECQNWGMNTLTVSAIGTVFFTFWQLYAAVAQSKKIWSGKPVESVSLQLFAYNFYYFVATLIYGIYQHKLAIIFNGLLFIPSLPIVIGILKFQKNEPWEKYFSFLGLLMIPAMIIFPQKNLVIEVVLSGLIVFIIIQVRDIMKNKKFGALSIEFIVIYLVVNVFWFIYGYNVGNYPYMFFCSLAIGLYSFGVYLFFRYKKINSTSEKKK